MKKPLARVIFFKLMGWTIKGEYPDTPKLIVAVVPHSSYFDFIVAVLTRTILNKRIKFLGKKELESKTNFSCSTPIFKFFLCLIPELK